MGAIQGRAEVVQAGVLDKGGAAYLYEIMLPPRPEGAVRIAQTDVTYTVPRAAVTILLNQGDSELAQQMSQEADRLEQSGQISSEGKKTINLTSRKAVKLSDLEDQS